MKLRQRVLLRLDKLRKNTIYTPKSQALNVWRCLVHRSKRIYRRFGRKLIAAGFETGHAYAKSDPYGKTCVGNSWCRFGVGDSVGLGVFLEHRYKGIRTPHKMKFGVSGCTRECSEAQGKDVGIIATEKGWNLNFGGNGGMKPRHGDLFAADLDEETLIHYIDRFMMFYIRTADKLQRTSVWLESLEGALNIYVRSLFTTS